ncbi:MULTISPECIES: hypothetical protein [Vitreoscilla]|uniref:Uncharacterized protein n=1 Tax=Vitreoscilla stercoraria TaxID=61 RepID=A0ABY4EBF9_VITST|nr:MULTISPECIES: hypothetical protein [Vitreoscilla]AUZ05501.1 hypothetical protein ADP71_20490 [Vitreoscilla sp. C1]UOO93084.1 hypothetical protein LVJ81_03380 [Vitreoscilla stercoraria]
MHTTQALSSYLRVILHLQDQPALQQHQKQPPVQIYEDGYTIETTTHHYYFANGVHIECEVEQEWQDGAACAGDVCPPCDISYRVVDAQGLHIQPHQKSFKNSCQMHFWIQAHHLPADDTGTTPC